MIVAILLGSFVFALAITHNFALALFGGTGLATALYGAAMLICERIENNEKKRQTRSRPLRLFRPQFPPGTGPE